MACWRVGGTERSSVFTGPFEGDHYLRYLHHSLVSGQTAGREHSYTHQQQIGWMIHWAWHRPSEQYPVSPTVSLSHQEASINLLSFSLTGQTNENHNHRKLIKLITWTTALSNSVKLWAMPCRATQDGRRVLTKCGTVVMANYFSILAFRTPWTVLKGKKIWYWKMNSPGG